MPRFSIIVPCFNAAATLDETLEGFVVQTETDWEAICVDDGSTDATAAILDAWSNRDGRVRRVSHAGKGPSAARNAGALREARGNIIAFCDADDFWQPEKLARLAGLFADASVDAAYGRVAFYPGDRTGTMRQSTVPEAELTIAALLAENPVCTMSNLSIRTDVFRGLGGFDETMTFNEDLEFLVRLAGEGARIVGDDALHLCYRTDAQGLSSDLDAMQNGRRRAIARAARYGVAPARRDEAVFLRYLARRALRLDGGAWSAFRFTVQGVATSPRGFLLPVRRGAATALAGLCAPLLPPALRAALFSA